MANMDIGMVGMAVMGSNLARTSRKSSSRNIRMKTRIRSTTLKRSSRRSKSRAKS